jgi:hypothetical protein
MTTDPGSRTRFIGRVFESAATLAQNEILIIDASDASTGAATVNQIAHGNDCDVRLESDPDGDGTWEQSVTVDSLTGESISQGNELHISPNFRLVIENTGAEADFIVTGVELAP